MRRFSRGLRPLSKRVLVKKLCSFAKEARFHSLPRCTTHLTCRACCSVSVYLTKTHTLPTSTSPWKTISAESRPSPTSTQTWPRCNCKQTPQSAAYQRGKSLDVKRHLAGAYDGPVRYIRDNLVQFGPGLPRFETEHAAKPHF